MRSIILCIEDDPFFQTLIEESLSRGRHFQLEFAANLAVAREKLKNQKYDAILLDLSLPDGDGLRFLIEKQRRDWELPSVQSVQARAVNLRPEFQLRI